MDESRVCHYAKLISWLHVSEQWCILQCSLAHTLHILPAGLFFPQWISVVTFSPEPLFLYPFPSFMLSGQQHGEWSLQPVVLRVVIVHISWLHHLAFCPIVPVVPALINYSLLIFFCLFVVVMQKLVVNIRILVNVLQQSGLTLGDFLVRYSYFIPWALKNSFDIISLLFYIGNSSNVDANLESGRK